MIKVTAEGLWNGLMVALKILDVVDYDSLDDYDKETLQRAALNIRSIGDFERLVKQLRNGDCPTAAETLEKLRLLL